MALVETYAAFVIQVTYKSLGNWNYKETYHYRKGVLKEENTYIFIFSSKQEEMYNVFCEGIAKEGWDVIYSKVAMNTVHPGNNRLFMVIIEKKTE